jgi:hypothetical protein
MTETICSREFPGMTVSLLRKSLCWMLIAVFPASLMAADAGAAMLYAKGEAWINGSAVPHSSAVFPGDLVQTKPDSVVNINASGSNVMILSDSMVKFEGNAVAIEHGTVTVATSKGMATHIGDVTVSPASAKWTEFEVTDVNGSVQIMARKGDVTINDGQDTTTLAQGQQTTRDEDQQAHKRKKRAGGGAATAAEGSVLNSPIAIGVGAAAIGGVLTWVLVQGDEPLSPTHP